jgi:hypothetical protein
MVMLRRAVASIAIACLGAIVACSSFGSSGTTATPDDAAAESSADGGANAEASTDGAGPGPTSSPCDDVPAHTACIDFEKGKSVGPWTLAETAGSTTLDTSVSVSPSTSLSMELAEGDFGVTALGFGFAPATKVHCEMWIARDASDSTASVDILKI